MAEEVEAAATVAVEVVAATAVALVEVEVAATVGALVAEGHLLAVMEVEAATAALVPGPPLRPVATAAPVRLPVGALHPPRDRSPAVAAVVVGRPDHRRTFRLVDVRA
jgi:hypothetical protein